MDPFDELLQDRAGTPKVEEVLDLSSSSFLVDFGNNMNNEPELNAQWPERSRSVSAFLHCEEWWSLDEDADQVRLPRAASATTLSEWNNDSASAPPPQMVMTMQPNSETIQTPQPMFSPSHRAKRRRVNSTSDDPVTDTESEHSQESPSILKSRFNTIGAKRSFGDMTSSSPANDAAFLASEAARAFSIDDHERQQAEELVQQQLEMDRKQITMETESSSSAAAAAAAAAIDDSAMETEAIEPVATKAKPKRKTRAKTRAKAKTTTKRKQTKTKASAKGKPASATSSSSASASNAAQQTNLESEQQQTHIDMDQQQHESNSSKSKSKSKAKQKTTAKTKQQSDASSSSSDTVGVPGIKRSSSQLGFEPSATTRCFSPFDIIKENGQRESMQDLNVLVNSPPPPPANSNMIGIYNMAGMSPRTPHSVGTRTRNRSMVQPIESTPESTGKMDATTQFHTSKLSFSTVRTIATSGVGSITLMVQNKSKSNEEGDDVFTESVGEGLVR